MLFLNNTHVINTLSITLQKQILSTVIHFKTKEFLEFQKYM